MYFTLRLSNYRETGYTVEYYESGKHETDILYSSLSKKLAFEEYLEVKKRIDKQSFKVIDIQDTLSSPYTIYECLLEFVLFKEGDLK